MPHPVHALLHFACTQATWDYLLFSNPTILCALLLLCISPGFSLNLQCPHALSLPVGNTVILLGSAQMLGPV